VAATKLSPFLRDLAAQQRAGDTYGQLDRLADEMLLRPFLVTREQQDEIAANCDVDAATTARVRSFYQAVAAGAEKATGFLTTTLLDLSHEGFGRVIVYAGRLLAVSEVLRDAQRFGFDSLDALSARGEALVADAVTVIQTYPEVARADD
jgi:probable nitrogen fixation protein